MKTADDAVERGEAVDVESASRKGRRRSSEEQIEGKNREGFFAVDRRCWAKVCESGLNNAVAYLIQAQGTGRDQRATSWSVQSVEKYTEISRSRAKAAIENLQSAGFTRLLRGGSHPRYEIRSWSEWMACTARLAPAEAKLLHS